MARAARPVIDDRGQMIKSCPVLDCSSHRKNESNKYQKLLEIEKEIVRDLSRGDKPHLRKDADRKIELNERLLDLYFAIYRFSQVRFITPSHLTFFLFPIVFIQWGLCALRHCIQISMEAILACHPARSTDCAQNRVNYDVFAQAPSAIKLSSSSAWPNQLHCHYLPIQLHPCPRQRAFFFQFQIHKNDVRYNSIPHVIQVCCVLEGLNDWTYAVLV